MAVSIVNDSSPVNEIIFRDTTMSSTLDVVKATNAVLFYLTADNTKNAGPVFVKVFDAAVGSVTLGTSDPDFIFKCPGGLVSVFVFYTGAAAFGEFFATAVTAACVVSGGTSGTQSPANPVDVKFCYV